MAEIFTFVAVAIPSEAGLEGKMKISRLCVLGHKCVWFMSDADHKGIALRIQNFTDQERL